MRRGIGAWIASYCEFEVKEPHAESILYRMIHEGQIQQPPPKSRVLCRDAPPHLRIMRIALHRIPDNQRICLWMKFSYPINKDGQMYTNAEVAQFLGLSVSAYRREIREGKRQVSAELHHMAA